MDNLFTVAQEKTTSKSLAEEVRPDALSDIFGQDHILGEDKVLRRKIEANKLGCVILYGPCGVGKTTIAKAVSKQMKKSYAYLHGAHSDSSDIKRVIAEAKERPTVVFIDEIHRFNSGVSDKLLAASEARTFDMLGATSMNPYHNLTPALVDRSTILELRSLSLSDTMKVVQRAAWRLKDDGIAITFEEGALEMLAGRAGGSARRALNALEDVTVNRYGQLHITKEWVDEVYQASPIPYDRKGDAHYDAISAFVKSMRGGDPDATLYWLAVIIHGGEDPRYIARRIQVHASEDCGLADNSALQTAVAAHNAVATIGYPEARIILAHAALHVCLAPKSSSAVSGIGSALAYVEREELINVPMHLRDTHYEGAAPLGRGGYRSPHSTAAGWVDQEYLPGIPKGTFYKSDARDNPTFEKKANEYWERVTGTSNGKSFD